MLTMSDDPTTTLDSATGTNGGGPSESKRLRSTIGFPYGSLKDAEQIAHTLHEQWGDSTSPEQLAASLDASPKSGAFRMKTGAARTFGLVAIGRGAISLTPLGKRILDPATRDAARVQAFLHVPLFKALHEEYKASPLPPDAGLESKIAVLGVSAKQTDKARQSFQRSAELAGFFKHGRGRLVAPPTHLPNSGASEPEGANEERKNVVDQAGPVPAAIQDLWLTLIRDGRSWSPETTHEFVEHARALHELLAKSS